MKKFKKILILLVCALCVCLSFSFAGCNDGDGYVDESFEYSIDASISSTYYYVDGQFEIKVGNAGKYKVTYTITTDGPGGKQQETKETTVTVYKIDENYPINFFVRFSRVNGKYNNQAYISDVRIKPLEKNNDEAAYAIGFGSVGGALLIASVVVFILDKCGILSKKK